MWNRFGVSVVFVVLGDGGEGRVEEESGRGTCVCSKVVAILREWFMRYISL